MENNNSIISKVKNIKHIEIYIAIILVFLLIVIYFLFVKKDTSIQTKDESLSTQISQILSNIEGVGKCQVLITYVDEVNVLSDKNTNNVQGVVVVCEGANNVKVVEDIVTAIRALLNVSSFNIKVYKFGGNLC